MGRFPLGTAGGTWPLSSGSRMATGACGNSLALRASVDSRWGQREALWSHARQALGVVLNVSAEMVEMFGAAHGVIPAFVLPKLPGAREQPVQAMGARSLPGERHIRKVDTGIGGYEDVHVVRHDHVFV